jgi:ADP-ribose pyrophosphatase YjhB (NUDIX family)
MKLLNVVIAGVMHEGDLLLIKRDKPPYKGYWGLPGGKMEFGEHLEDTAKREIQEETGLTPDFVELRGIASEIVYSQEKKKNHFLLYVCEMEATQKTGQRDDLKWFSLNDLDANKEKIIPSDLLMINEFLLGDKKAIPVHKVKMLEKGEEYVVESFHQ